MILAMYDMSVIVFHVERSLPVPSQCWEIVENANIYIFPKNKFNVSTVVDFFSVANESIDKVKYQEQDKHVNEINSWARNHGPHILIWQWTRVQQPAWLHKLVHFEHPQENL